MTKQVVYVTGNPNKLKEAQAILSFKLKSATLDLLEIQSLDGREIIQHKLHQAYKELKCPVIVDDVSAELASLNGLPGPFIKFFEKQLGEDALYKLTKVQNDEVKIICYVGYYDGNNEVIVEGILSGSIVSPRGNRGWGFDKVVVPHGYEKTMAEMGPEIKNTLSHRYKALTALAEKLKAL